MYIPEVLVFIIYIYMYVYKYIDEKPAKMAKMQPRFGGSLLWPTTWVGHELGGSALHQCRWADVVWAPRYRDYVMGCCGVWSFFNDLSFLVNSHLDHSRSWIPACSPNVGLLHRCIPSNLSTTTQGAIVKLRGTSSEWCTLLCWSVWNSKITSAQDTWSANCSGVCWEEGMGDTGVFVSQEVDTIKSYHWRC